MVITHNEAVVLEIVRKAAQRGHPVPAVAIKTAAWHRGIRYDAVDYALRRLMENGTVERVSRGHYLPVSDA